MTYLVYRSTCTFETPDNFFYQTKNVNMGNLNKYVATTISPHSTQILQFCSIYLPSFKYISDLDVIDSPSCIVWHLSLQFILRLVDFITHLTHVNSGQYTLLSIIDAAFLLWCLTFDVFLLIACIITFLFNGDFICNPGDPNMDHKLEKIIHNMYHAHEWLIFILNIKNHLMKKTLLYMTNNMQRIFLILCVWAGGRGGGNVFFASQTEPKIILLVS